MDDRKTTEKPSFAELSGSSIMQAVSTAALVVLAAAAAYAKAAHAGPLVTIVISVLLLIAVFAFSYVAARWIALAQAAVTNWIDVRGNYTQRGPK